MLFLGPQLHLIRTESDLSPNETYLASGGTLAFRTSVSATANGIYISGEGTYRDYYLHDLIVGDIGAIYNEGGANTIAQSIILEGHTSFGGRHSRVDNLTLLRVTQANPALYHDFTKVGSGLITLGSTNYSWRGSTNITRGVFRIGSALPSGNIRFGGGILELTNADFTRNLGTGINQMWLRDGGGGFSAFGANRSVTLNGGAELNWGTGGFLNNIPFFPAKFRLSSRYANAEVNFTNPINVSYVVFSSSPIHVERGTSTAAIARLSGKIRGDGIIVKEGPGLLWLSNTSNTFSGEIAISEGALRGVFPDARISFYGGVLGLDSHFTRNLGVFLGSEYTQWHKDSDGGFAAYGANRIVRLNNTTAEIAWGADYFVQSGKELIFGHYTANAAVIWDRALNFGDTMRTIRVERGTGVSATNVIFNRALINNAKTGGLRLVGNGIAELATDSVNLNSDRLEISGATLRLASANVRLGAIGNIHISEGGQFTILGHNGGSFASAQISDTTNITLNTGSLLYRSSQSSPEQMGNLSLEGGDNWIQVDKNSPNVVELRAQSLQREESARSTLNLIGFSTGGALGGRNSRFVESIAEHEIGGIIPWATNGIDNGAGDWLTPSGDNRLVAFSDYVTTWTPSSNTMAGGGSYTLPVATTINSLKFSSGTTLTLNNSLTLNSGGLITTGINGSSVFSGTGTITTAQNRPLYTHIHNSGLTFNDSVRVVGGMDWVIKSHTGPPLRYNSTGTSQIGSLYIHAGTVHLHNGFLNTGANGQVFIGDGAGWDELRISGGTNRLASKPRVNLRGTPYGAGAEFGPGEQQATLAIADGAQQTLSELHIIDRGTIDFSGGTVSTPNRLFLDKLSFNKANAQLFVRGWHEFENYLLLKKTADAYARWGTTRESIVFDGYSLDYQLQIADYSDDYWEITPWGMMGTVPEPATTGAILGAVGIGLVLWRKKTQRLGLRPRPLR